MGMILLVAFPAISKSTINFASLLKKPDPETKMKCDQLSELRKMVVEYAKKSVDQADDLLISLDNYVNMLIDTTPMLIAKGAKNPKFSWQTSMLKSAKEINSSENKIGDFNIEVLMCLFLKAMVKSVLAERILGKLTKQMHPEVEQFKTCWAYLVDAAKIINFIASVGLNYLPKMSASERAGLPELSVEILNGLARLLLAESEMVAIEKGLAEKAPSLTPLKITGVYKDLMNKLDEASNYFNDGLSALSSSAKSNFRKYYLVYCQAMKACYEVIYPIKFRCIFGIVMPLPLKTIKGNSDWGVCRSACGA
eukprot:TRINITY_DN917_c0_g1_i11.p1 TRINITY_DN917_c0_g1~~TRINITY_DN917_c0_g1_i11.p1  ORF type:complete len:309 (-),score=107.55 TRINITY_DN917_c0_g1_i11:351-1277(-)